MQLPLVAGVGMVLSSGQELARTVNGKVTGKVVKRLPLVAETRLSSVPLASFTTMVAPATGVVPVTVS